MAVIAWLLGSKLGRYVALGGLLTVAVLFLLARVYSEGRARERARQAEATARAIAKRIQTDDEIMSLPADQRRARLSRWVRD